MHRAQRNQCTNTESFASHSDLLKLPSRKTEKKKTIQLNVYTQSPELGTVACAGSRTLPEVFASASDALFVPKCCATQSPAGWAAPVVGRECGCKMETSGTSGESPQSAKTALQRWPEWNAHTEEVG